MKSRGRRRLEELEIFAMGESVMCSRMVVDSLLRQLIALIRTRVYELLLCLFTNIASLTVSKP